MPPFSARCCASELIPPLPALQSFRGDAYAPNNVTPLCPFGHQGLMHDQALGSNGGLIYNRARELNPTLGRFMQRDPFGYVDGMSLYQYCGSDPAENVDPTGLYAFWEHISSSLPAAKQPLKHHRCCTALGKIKVKHRLWRWGSRRYRDRWVHVVGRIGWWTTDGYTVNSSADFLARTVNVYSARIHLAARLEKSEGDESDIDLPAVWTGNPYYGPLTDEIMTDNQKELDTGKISAIKEYFMVQKCLCDGDKETHYLGFVMPGRVKLDGWGQYYARVDPTAEAKFDFILSKLQHRKEGICDLGPFHLPSGVKLTDDISDGVAKYRKPENP